MAKKKHQRCINYLCIFPIAITQHIIILIMYAKITYKMHYKGTNVFILLKKNYNKSNERNDAVVLWFQVRGIRHGF